MRTNVVINDDLMASALKVSGLKTKKDVIEEGLKLLVQVQGQKAIKNFRGKLKWVGNLDEMRTDKLSTFKKERHFGAQDHRYHDRDFLYSLPAIVVT
jgi:Arc/MetJ family transcription regulator